MSHTFLNRRDFLKGAAMAAVGSLAAACAPAATQAPSQEQPVEPSAPTEPAAPPANGGAVIRYWSQWGGEGYQKCWDEIQALDSFKQMMGNNTLEVKLAVGEEPMLTAIAGGDPPDVGTNINYLGFMSRDVLLPLTDLVAASTEVKPEKFVKGNWALGEYKGVLYGFPTQECFLRFGLNYNSQLVEEAGLDPNAPPETWDDLLAWHEKLTQKDSAGNLTRLGINPYGAMGEGFWDSDGCLVATSWNWTWFDDKTKKFNLNSPELVEAFTIFKKFIDVCGVDNMGALYSVEGRDTWGGAYNAGVECALIEGYWHPGETFFSAPEISKVNRASWVPVPSSRKGVKPQGAGGHLWTIIKGSKSAEAAFKLGEYMNQKEPCDIIWKNQGWLPAVTSYLDTVDASVYPGLDFYFKSYKEATEWHFGLRCEITSFASTEYLSLKDQVNREEMTPEQAAEELQKRCEAEYQNQGFA